MKLYALCSWASRYGVLFTDIPVFMTLASFLFVSYNNMYTSHIPILKISPFLRFLPYIRTKKSILYLPYCHTRLTTGVSASSSNSILRARELLDESHLLRCTYAPSCATPMNGGVFNATSSSLRYRTANLAEFASQHTGTNSIATHWHQLDAYAVNLSLQI